MQWYWKSTSPNATWSAVQTAAQGAAVLVYLGHGSGYPNPYVSYLQPDGDNGMGLNATAGNGDSNTKYYGEDYMAQLNLAPNAVVLLNHLCYASGDNEWGRGLPSLATAETRVDGYASGFLRGNARAVIAEGLGDLGPYIDAIFTAHETIDQMWKTYPGFHNNVTSWASTRNSGFTSEIDPDIQHPASDGDYYYRSMVSWPGLTTDTVGVVKSVAATYHPLAPARVLDTVAGTGLTGPLTSHVARTFQVTGQGGVPAGATAVTGNLTVTGQTSLGYLFIGPVAMNDPASSNLNFPAGDTRANGVTVALGSGGTLSITYAASDLTATAGAIFDVTGYFTPDMTGATYFPLPPTRILDTRPTATGSNTPAVGNLIGPIGAQVAKTFQVTGQGGVPAGATAVTGNLTVTAQTSAGSLYLGPTAAAKPAIATLDFPVADNRADGVTMMLGSGGTLSFTLVAPAGQTAQVVFDVTGYFLPGTTAGDTYHSLTPTRLLDSRPTAKSGNPLNIGLSGPFHSHVARTFQVTGMWVPSNATAVTGNLTVTQQTSLGYLYIGPVAMNNPTSSSLNFPKSDNRANEVTVSLGSGGKLSVTYAASATTPTAQAIFDVAGYFTPAG